MRHNSINMFIDKYMDFDKWMEEERKAREREEKRVIKEEMENDRKKAEEIYKESVKNGKRLHKWT